jgi:Uma2 family endonuclease
LLRRRLDFYRSSHPEPGDVLLIVEVAESSLRYGREIKIRLYAKHGIPEVWLIDLQHNRLSRCSKPVEGVYQEVVISAPLTKVTLVLLPDVTLNLSSLF